MSDSPKSDLELFQIQAEMSLDDRGRIARSAGITIATTPQERVLLVGAEVPDPVAEELRITFERALHGPDPTVEPPALKPCAQTAAWAAMLEPTGRHLFYSTDAGNLSSQRVAARLRLRMIGWTWNLAKEQA